MLIKNSWYLYINKRLDGFYIILKYANMVKELFIKCFYMKNNFKKYISIFIYFICILDIVSFNFFFWFNSYSKLISEFGLKIKQCIIAV